MVMIIIIIIIIIFIDIVITMMIIIVNKRNRFLLLKFYTKENRGRRRHFSERFFSKTKRKSTKKCQDDILQVKRSLYVKIRQFLSNFCFWTKIVTYALFLLGPSITVIVITGITVEAR